MLSNKIAIASANGSGKSSLAKAILDNGKLFSTSSDQALSKWYKLYQ
ncbi:hypothetical protein [Fischerella thermalis]|nr:hypothetical protein [Fischerella thermalis]